MTTKTSEGICIDSSRPTSVRWPMILDSLTRPYPVTVSMIVLVSLIPLYLFIPVLIPFETLHAPELALDRAIPLLPAWSIVYGALYLYLILLPMLVVRQEEQIRRTVRAYLSVWITAHLFFILWPTVAPRPEVVTGEGFGAWGLRQLYGADTPYNCFPSLHVTHSFVSALTVFRVHRNLGVLAIAAAAVVALSTLFAKQHYLLDVVAGAFMAWVAYRIFLAGYSRENVPGTDRLVAPVIAAGAACIIALGVLGFWVAFQLQVLS